MDLMHYSALIVGLVGSLHCVGMCGPIAVALPKLGTSSWSVSLGALLYNLGRIITYAFLGMMVGLSGTALHMVGFQQGLSIFAGLVLMLGATWVSIGKALPDADFMGGRLGKAFRYLWKEHSAWRLIGIGLINGLLPCGFVYVGLTGALAMGTPTEGALYMSLFGVGTTPALLGLSLAGNQLSLRWRNTLKVWSPKFALLLGLLFVLRGMELGIPLISPLGKAMQVSAVESCH